MKKQLFILLFIAYSTAAAQSIHIHALNFPVWMETGQSRTPLSPGAELRAGDIVQTGSLGRAWLALADGSVIKLGQNTRFEIGSAEFQQAQETALLSATLNLIKGAFRYTSGFFASKFRSKQRINMRIGAVTVGIRGTDIWGRSSADEDFVALLQGTIMAGSDADAEVLMDQPLTRYLKKRDQAAAGVSAVSMDAVEKLAAETELDSAQGIATIDGRFDLILMSLSDPKYVEKMITRYEQAGYALSVEPVIVNFEKFQRLKISGFVSRQAAQAVATRLQNEFALDSLWIRPADF